MEMNWQLELDGEDGTMMLTLRHETRDHVYDAHLFDFGDYRVTRRRYGSSTKHEIGVGVALEGSPMMAMMVMLQIENLILRDAQSWAA